MPIYKAIVQCLNMPSPSLKNVAAGILYSGVYVLEWVYD